MTQKVSRRWVLGALASGVALPVFAEAPATSLLPRPRGEKARVVPQDASALIAAAKLGGAVGYLVADAVSGQVLEAVQGDLHLPPASVAKTITTLYALEKLGQSHRFGTRLVATGPVQAGKVQGDLVLVGSGDPTLDTDRLGDMAAALAARGVRGVTGRYLIYAGALPLIERIDAEQPEFVGYNPALSGLNLNYNRVNFEWRRSGKGYDVGMDARAERFVPVVKMARVKVVQRDAPLFTYAAGQGTEEWTVAATALGKAGSRWMPVRKPAVYTAEVFATLAQAQGITLPPATMIASPPQGQTLVEDFSDPLPIVLRDMLKFSTNLTAEVMGLSASGAMTLASSGAQMTAWAAERMGLSAAFVDHSGLELGVADVGGGYGQGAGCGAQRGFAGAAEEHRDARCKGQGDRGASGAGAGENRDAELCFGVGGVCGSSGWAAACLCDILRRCAPPRCPADGRPRNAAGWPRMGQARQADAGPTDQPLGRDLRLISAQRGTGCGAEFLPPCLRLRRVTRFYQRVLVWGLWRAQGFGSGRSGAGCGSAWVLGPGAPCPQDARSGDAGG